MLKDPAPLAFLTGFAESGVELELGFWIADPDQGTLGVKSAIGLELLRRFRAEEIEIPFPRRECGFFLPRRGQTAARACRELTGCRSGRTPDGANSRRIRVQLGGISARHAKHLGKDNNKNHLHTNRSPEEKEIS